MKAAAQPLLQVILVDVRMPVMDGIVRMKARRNDGLRHDDFTSVMRLMLWSGRRNSHTKRTLVRSVEFSLY